MKITTDMVVPAYESKYVKVYDLQYEEGKHYLDATRRDCNNIVATKSDEEFKNLIPDAVTIAVIINSTIDGTITPDEPRVLLSREYRYPTGQFLLSPPAGLIDPEDMVVDNPLLVSSKREILEETGLVVKDTDRLEVINPCLFSTPGMSDESNAMILAVLDDVDLSQLDQSGAVGSELFDGNVLLTRAEAKQLLKSGRDNVGHFYSAYTWIVLMCFISDMWL